jgi:MoaE-MoaD fusion protein
MNKISILFFATLKDKVGFSRLDLEIPPDMDVKKVKQRLVELYPALAPQIDHSIASINQEFAYDLDLIPLSAEMAFFPPVSGGSVGQTIVKITRESLNLDEIAANITQNTTGGICIFTGVVRGETRRDDPHTTKSLEYEAYIPMAEAKMRQVADEIRSQWPAVDGIVIIQRIGLLEPGTPTVVVACSAAHRDIGIFEAARFGIDRLKEIVPVWKKEISPDGETWVEGDYFPHQGD